MTLEDLKIMPPHTIFATGVALDNPDGLNMTNSGKELRWVAVRGEIYDWAIYCHWSEHDINWIYENGDKITYAVHIRKLVHCDDTMFKMYRY